MKLIELARKYPLHVWIKGGYAKHFADDLLAYVVFEDRKFSSALILRNPKGRKITAIKAGNYRPLEEVWDYIKGSKFTVDMSGKDLIEAEVQKKQFVKKL